MNNPDLQPPKIRPDEHEYVFITMRIGNVMTQREVSLLFLSEIASPSEYVAHVSEGLFQDILKVIDEE